MKAERVQFRIIHVPEWELEPRQNKAPEAICRTYSFCDFVDSVDFVCQITALSLDHKHYPEVRINGRDVFVRLTSPKVGVTDLDFDLAEMYDAAA